MSAFKIHFLLILFLTIFTSCESTKDTGSKMAEAVTDIKELGGNANDLLSPPEWAKDATLYEVNLRQYTEEGTFKSFLPHIPRLKDMGIDILWFMPIYPISETNRKGTLGSYYSVSDFTAVNEAEHGDLADFKEMVAAIHRAGMRIILDYVPNHTGWDHEWITTHPEYYTKNAKGEITEPLDEKTGKSLGWTDVADLNFDNKKMRLALINEMKWWLTECDVDGFRMDIAYAVPTDFWDQCIPELMRTKKIFLLAEAEVPHLRNVSGFAADYGWKFHHLMNGVAAGTKNSSDLVNWFETDRKAYSRGYHIHFTSNHDENSWNGTEFDRMGDGYQAYAVLAATIDGMPLVYSGQEEPLKRKLQFFEKDLIGFKNYDNADFYRTLLSLKKNNKALRNGKHGGEAKFLTTSNDSVVAYSRMAHGDNLVVVINLSATQQSVQMSTAGLEGPYNNVFGNSTISLASQSKFNLKPWDYLVLSKAK